MADQTTHRMDAAFRWLDQSQPAMVEMLRRWCQQNSGSHHPAGLQAMATMLEEDFASLGAAGRRWALPELEEIGNEGQTVRCATGPALQWDHQPTAAQRVLLMIHYDTVYPPGASPSRCTATDDGRLVGPGTADAKGGIAVLRWAIAAVRQFDLDQGIGWTILLNPDEELGSPASAATLAELAPQFDFALVFEPALPDGAWVADRKGSGNWTYVVRGRSAHAGRNPADGRNAIVQAARLTAELDALNQPADGVTLNIGRTTGGGALNRVPDVATVHLNIRVATEPQQLQIQQRLRDLATRYDSADGFRCQLHGRFHAPPKRADAAALRLRQHLQQAAEQVGRTVRWRDTGGACDGSQLAALGLPNVDTLGPTGDHLHSPDEFCWLGSLLPAAKTIVRLMADFAADPQAFARPR